VVVVVAVPPLRGVVVVTVVVVVTGVDTIVWPFDWVVVVETVDDVVTTVMVLVDVVVTVVVVAVFPLVVMFVVVVVEFVIGAGIDPEFGVNPANPPPTSIWPLGWRVIASTKLFGSGSKVLSRDPLAFNRAR
jgi:hypothetical protein